MQPLLDYLDQLSWQELPFLEYIKRLDGARLIAEIMVRVPDGFLCWVSVYRNLQGPFLVEKVAVEKEQDLVYRVAELSEAQLHELFGTASDRLN